MRILFFATSFNGMTQRAWVELDRLNHQVKVYIASGKKNMADAVAEFKPDLIIAPYLKTRIPDDIWKNYTCFIIHPGIVGDRGSSSIDWAILNNEKEWGVTVLQAVGKMDSGPVCSTAMFPMQNNVSKSFLYRHAVTDAAMTALLDAVKKFQEKSYALTSTVPLDQSARGKWNRSTNENDFKFSWNEKTGSIMRKINAADSFPGALSTILNEEFFCYGAVEEKGLTGKPGEIIGKRDQAICISTSDTAIWVQCLKKNVPRAIKLPAANALGDKAKGIPVLGIDILGVSPQSNTFNEIKYAEADHVGYLYFDFYNGAMSTEQCNRLRDAFIKAKEQNTKVIVMMGGADIWSNGIHLNVIEASEDPARAAWENINAIDDLIREIICTESHYIISALRGNAGAGGVSLALAADKVLAKRGIVFNPHTRNMGLYGSEYWTYLLPRRVGDQKANLFTEQCLPWGTDIAMEVKLIDDILDNQDNRLDNAIIAVAGQIARLSYFTQLLIAKRFKRKRDESYKPLEQYRKEELEKMHSNFFDDDCGFDHKRYCFVHKVGAEEKENGVAEKDLFSERRKIWRRRKYEKLYYEA